MVKRFGSREICDVNFKALTNDFVVGNKTFKAGQPVFIIDTATASSMEQAATTVYAQGGKGYSRLIAWEGEKTMTFNVTEALMSPLGLKILTGAGLSDATSGAPKHIHVTVDAMAKDTGVVSVPLATLIAELGLPKTTSSIEICEDDNVKAYATVLDHNGAIVDWVSNVVITTAEATTNKAAVFTLQNEEGTAATAAYDGKTVKLDFYVVLYGGATEITISPEDFGGYFYVEADTLYRNEDGKDMAATITFPKVKVQSGFTLSMSPTGDPSTFEFIMDAFPAYTYFDKTKKVMCDITIVGGDTTAEAGVTHATAHRLTQGTAEVAG